MLLLGKLNVSWFVIRDARNRGSQLNQACYVYFNNNNWTNCYALIKFTGTFFLHREYILIVENYAHRKALLTIPQPRRDRLSCHHIWTDSKIAEINFMKILMERGGDF